VRHPVIRTPLTELGADQLGHLHLHQLLHHPAQRLAQNVGVLVAHQLGDDLIGRHPLPLGHRGAPSSNFAGPTMLSAAVARTTFRPPRSYTTLWDAT
jgi:hypothetical protein